MSPRASRGTVSRRSGKYGAKRTVYRGVTYDSKSEAAYAAKLDLEKKAGIIKGWERQVPVQLVSHGKKICRIIPDFLVTLSDGRQEFHECKSKATATPIWRLKVKLFRAQFPDAVYTVVWS